MPIQVRRSPLSPQRGHCYLAPPPSSAQRAIGSRVGIPWAIPL